MIFTKAVIWRWRHICFEYAHFTMPVIILNGDSDSDLVGLG